MNTVHCPKCKGSDIREITNTATGELLCLVCVDCGERISIVCPKCHHSLEKQPGEMAPLDYYCRECKTGYQLKDGQLLAVGGIVPQDCPGFDRFDGCVIPNNVLQPIIKRAYKEAFKSGFIKILKEKLGVEITPELEVNIDKVLDEAEKENIGKQFARGPTEEVLDIKVNNIPIEEIKGVRCNE